MGVHLDDPRAGGQAVQRLRDLFHHGTYSDLSVDTQPVRHVHKAIVCVESPIIARLCSGELKNSKIVRVDQDGWLKFPHIRDDIVHSLFEFMYTYDYIEYVPYAMTAGKLFEFHVRVYIAAYELNMAALIQLAGSKACAIIDDFQNFGHVNDFIIAIRTVYRDAPNTATDLRGKLVAVAATHADKLLGHKDAKTQRFPFRDLLDELKGFGTDFKLALYELREGTARQHYCSLCNMGFSTDLRAVNKVHCPYCKRNGGLAL